METSDWIALAALTTSVIALWRVEVREVRKEKAVEEQRLGVETQTIEGVHFVSLSFDPPADHTRYTMVVEIREPIGAVMADPSCANSLRDMAVGLVEPTTTDWSEGNIFSVELSKEGPIDADGVAHRDLRRLAASVVVRGLNPRRPRARLLIMVIDQASMKPVAYKFLRVAF